MDSWTVKRLLEWTTDYLKKNARQSSRLEAEILLAAALSCQRIELYTNFDMEPPEDKRAVFRDYVKRRAAGEPVAYLVGRKEFYSLSFQVNRNTLIPRPETEQLVVESLDWIKARQAADSGFAPNICDVGTGSGAIAIAIAHSLKKANRPGKITAVDLSEQALDLAKKNGEKHNVSDRIQWIASDLLENADGPFDLIVSNPPYVSEPEYEQLEAEVRNYEPKTALLAGPKGTEIIEKLLPQACARLNNGGQLLCELSPMIAEAVVGLFEGSQWKNVRLLKDLAGLHRIVAAEF
ncbi:MAG: peptide chain release factor N(5)-glutamine methyltransferase [Planctomycetaceae bacterium]|nr:peptide chain release factor N(5)-glutamine methyltransferase [Planctomycetaceae bacterium]